MRQNFITVQITLLSVIVALILENLLSTLHGLQPATGSAWLLRWLSVLTLGSALISIWGGFALVTLLSNRPPVALDFLAPFGLLIFLFQAVVGIGDDDTWHTLLALVAASALASLILWVEHRFELGRQQRGEAKHAGPRRPALVQMMVALVGVLGVIYLYFQPVDWVGLIVFGFMLVVQIGGIVGIVLGWQDAFAVTEQAMDA